MKKKFTLALACVMAMTTMLTACGGSGQTPASDGSSGAITVKYSVTFPATGTQADGANALAELIEEDVYKRQRLRRGRDALRAGKTVCQLRVDDRFHRRRRCGRQRWTADPRRTWLCR